ncbi:GNAT family N-acetyltransferase [Pseudoroseicyclus tamaricis]|uniref:GNAT family N-acetyltransferase n=1 Tax=Pseudoroseicyclus tamaricis TaxID=2705421 RepID=A0A6B2K064_9RHOB|nr:GNAT family N-acetyltransferase [Pseudoroseicyclus tamaricis]NDV01062.1 GNAT family N-acetyltransferase [Pseudoroseicyclus tamaricis]
MDAPVRIGTPRLTLRERREEDFPAFLAMVSNREVIEYCAVWPHPMDEAIARSRFRPFDPERGQRVAVVRDGRFIGQVTLAAGWLGLIIDRPHWGQGIAGEACRAFLTHVFRARPELGEIHAGHIHAGHFEANRASGHLLASLGFVETGRTIQDSLFHGEALPGVELTLTRAGWERMPWSR